MIDNNKPTSENRPIGNLRYFLEDLAFRGFDPRGILDVGANHGYWTQNCLLFYQKSMKNL